MGCDYYIIVALIVEYNKNDTQDICFIKLDRFRMYFMFIYNYDEDRDDYDKLANKEIEQVAEIYSNMNRILYQNKKWNVQDKDRINEYYNHLNSKCINLDDVTKLETKYLKMKKTFRSKKIIR